MANPKFTLKLIEREIERLEKQSSSTGLTLADAKKLKLLIESGQALITNPIPESDETDNKDRSDQEVIEALKKKE